MLWGRGGGDGFAGCGTGGYETDFDAGQVDGHGPVNDGGKAVLEPFYGPRGPGLHDEAVPVEGDGPRAPQPVIEGPALHVQGEVVEGFGPKSLS